MSDLDQFNQEVDGSEETQAEQNVDSMAQSFQDESEKHFQKAKEKAQGKAKQKIKDYATRGSNNAVKPGMKKAGAAAKKGLKAGTTALKSGAKAVGGAITKGFSMLMPVLIKIGIVLLIAFGALWILSILTGSIVDNEFSRTNTAHYYHMDTENTNALLESQLDSGGNVYFNKGTGRYELARGKMPTVGNKLYFAYYAAMSKNSQWFVEYEVNPDFNIEDPPSDENPYLILRTIPENKKRYTLDGHLYSAINMDNVAERINYNEPITPDVAFSEEIYTYIEKLAMNVNLLYLLDSTLNGSQTGMGKNQMFFAEQFVKPVHHDKPIETIIHVDKPWWKRTWWDLFVVGDERKVKLHGYNFKPLTEYRDMTPEELEKFASKSRPVSGLNQNLTDSEEDSGLVDDAGYQDFKQNAKVHFIGDSLLAGLTGSIQSQIPNATVDAQVSREFYGGPGVDGEGALKNIPANTDTLVISLGTNAGIDETDLSRFVDQASRYVPNVVLVTTGSNVGHRDRTNESIKRVASTKGNVSVADWDTFVRQNGRDGIYGSDDIHMSDTAPFVDFLVKGSYSANNLSSDVDIENSSAEEAFQTNYTSWVKMVETQNLNRGGTLGSESDTPDTSSGVDNPLLARALQIGKEWIDAGFSYSMESRMGPYSYDCSSFVSLTLREAGMVGVPDWTFTTVTMLQNTDTHGGNLFREIKPRESAKKGAIVIAGGLGGSGAAGHTAFLAEDYHGPETKVMESTATAVDGKDGGTYALTMGGQIEWDPNWVAIEPIQQTLDGSDMPSDLSPGGPEYVTSPIGYTSSGKSVESGGGAGSGRSMSRNLTFNYDEPVQSEWNGMVSTGRLISESREFDTNYDPLIVPGNDENGNIFRSQEVRYNIWRRDDFYLEEAPDSGSGPNGSNPFNGPMNDGSRGSTQSGEYLDRIRNWKINSDDSSITAADVDNYLNQMNLPGRPIQPEFLGNGKKFKEIADKYGVNVVVLLGQMALETQLGYETCGGAEYNFGCMMYADWQNEMFGSTSIGPRPWSNPPDAWAGVEQQAYLVQFNYIDKGFIKYGDYLERYSPGFENHTDGPNSSSHNGFAKMIVQTGEMMGYDFPENAAEKTPGGGSEGGESVRYHNKGKTGSPDVDGISQLQSHLDIKTFSSLIGNSQFTPNNGPDIGAEGGAALPSILDEDGSSAINMFNGYNEDRDDLLVWAMDNDFNPAYAVALINILTNNGTADMIGTKYNFLNDPDVVENIGGQGYQDLGEASKPGTNIEHIIEEIMKDVPAGVKWQVSVEPIGDAGVEAVTSGNELGKMNSASTIKVAIAVMAYEAGLVGNTVSESQIQSMINQSDNNATNEVLDALGAHNGIGGFMRNLRPINEKLRDIGMTESSLGRYMLKEGNNLNVTTTKDLARLLANLDNYAGADKIKQYMTNTSSGGEPRLLSQLPEGATGINKSGENDGLRNDSAIITANGKSVAVAVMMESVDGENGSINTGIANELQGRLGKAIAEALLEEEEEEEEDREEEGEEEIDPEARFQSDEDGRLYDSRYGSQFYSFKYKVNDVYQGMDHVLEQILKDNPDKVFTDQILIDNLQLTEKEAKEVFSIAQKLGALVDTPFLPEETGANVKVFTYGGSGPDDEEGLGNIRINGQVDDTKIGESLKYYTASKDIPFGDAVRVAGTTGKAIKGYYQEGESGWFTTWFGAPTKEYIPQMTTGIWDHGFGSIFKIAKQEYIALPVYVDQDGKYKVLPGNTFTQIKNFFQGNGNYNIAVSDNEYVMLGIVTPFGSIDMMEEYISEITKLNSIIRKLANGEELTEAEETTMMNHTEQELYVRNGVDDDGNTIFEKRRAEDEESASLGYYDLEGNYHPETADFYATNRVKRFDTNNKLKDTHGRQYLYDYLVNYEVYVPHITEHNLNVVERFRRMNDITMGEQEGVDHIIDIFNRLFDDGTDGGGGSGDKGTGSDGSFGDMEENMKLAYEKLTAGGLSSAAAVGLISNMIVESKVDPTAVFSIYDSPGVMNDAKRNYLAANPNRPIGLIQWLGERRHALEAAAEQQGVDWYDFDFQIDYIFKESNHKEILPRMNQEPNTKEGARKAADGFFLVSEMHGGNMSFYDTDPHSDASALANIPDRNNMEQIEKIWNTVVDSPIDADEGKLSSNMSGGGSGGNSSSNSSKADGGIEASNVEIWGDGTGFRNNIYFAFHSINDTIMNVFGDGQRSQDPTMFATEPTYNDNEFFAYWMTKINRTFGWGSHGGPSNRGVSDDGSDQRDATVDNNTQLYNNQGMPWGDGELIINGADAYRWSKHSNKLTPKEAEFVIRQFIAVLESRDARPVYYDEIHDRFNDYEESRVIEEYYKFNLMKIFEAQESEESDWRNNAQSGINSGPLTSNDESLEVIENFANSGTGYTLKGEPGIDIYSRGAGQVEYASGDTVIIRSDNLGLTAYYNLGTITVARGQEINKGHTIGTSNADGVFSIANLQPNSNITRGLDSVHDSDFQDAALNIGINQHGTEDNQNHLHRLNDEVNRRHQTLSDPGVRYIDGTLYKVDPNTRQPLLGRDGQYITLDKNFHTQLKPYLLNPN